MTGHEVLLTIAASVALLLWSTRLVQTGVMRAYGPDVRHALGRSTKNRIAALAMGTGVAGLLQSSTATALLIVSFAGSGLIGTGPAIAVMLGADIGSTLVVQVLSLDISWMSPLLILLGVATFLTSTKALRRHFGRILIGLGLILLSLAMISDATEPLRGSLVLQNVMTPLSRDPILAVMIAALLTWLVHSSVAMVLLIMSLTAAGVIPITLGVALVLGANVGSGLIAVALTAKAGAEARRVPLCNLFFRTIGAVAALSLIEYATPWIAELESAPARQIANAHTAFNVSLALVFLPLTSLAARLAEKILPAGEKDDVRFQPRYLDPDTIDSPQVALANATREVLRMADTVEEMLRGTIEVLRDNNPDRLKRLGTLDDEVDELYHAIKLYLTKVSQNVLNEEDSKRCVDIIGFTTNLEHIGDIVDKSLLEIAEKKTRKQLVFSEEGWQELTTLHDTVLKTMHLAISVFVSGDLPTARQLLGEKERFRAMERENTDQHLNRLRMGRLESIETSALHLDILNDLKRIHSHLTAVAYPILDTFGELRQSRLKMVGEP